MEWLYISIAVVAAVLLGNVILLVAASTKKRDEEATKAFKESRKSKDEE